MARMNIEAEFAKAYPVIAQSIRDGTAGPNERWLKQIWFSGFYLGVKAKENESEDSQETHS